MTNPLENARDTGLGSYPRYRALWHLERVGLEMAQALATPDGWPNGWQEALSRGTPTRIALIDTPVSFDSPNLQGVFDHDKAIDFTTAAPLDPLELAPDSPVDRAAAIEAQVAAYLADPPPYRAAEALNAGSHGTAMAGVLGARPAMAALYRPERLGLDGQAEDEPAQAELMPLPYAGIDPTCRILPIAVSARPGPDELFAAFVYAEATGVDMIVIAIDMPRPVDDEGNLTDYGRSSESYLGAAALTGFWELLSARIVAISRSVPVFCGAGNEPDRLAYPAALAALDDNGIFAVGALSSAGEVASYSPGPDMVTLFGPSGDTERVDRAAKPRLDVYRDDFGDEEEAYYVETPDSYTPLPVLDVITTDLPGPYGYNASVFDAALLPCGEDGHTPCAVPLKDTAGFADSPVAAGLPAAEAKKTVPVFLDFGSSFFGFNGTSAASAVVAGLYSLGLSSGRLAANDPVAFKRAVQAAHPGAAPAADWALLGAVAGA